jgi:hypothetical protein
MLERWFGEARDRFVADFYLREPFALPSTGQELVHLAAWEILPRILGQVPEPDVLVVRNGRYFPEIQPRSAQQVECLFAAGFSIVIRNAERHDSGLLDLCSAFAQELKARVAVQLYATPAGFHGFGWHYDAEEVFILQTSGCKEYFLRRTTVHPSPVWDAMPKDMQYGLETSSLQASTLVTGDVLYIPAGMWHMARAIEPSLSISVGVFAKSGIDALDAARTELILDPLWRQRIPFEGAARVEHVRKLRGDLIVRLQDLESLVELLAEGEQERPSAAETDGTERTQAGGGEVRSSDGGRHGE